jgi:hypothetical protein
LVSTPPTASERLIHAYREHLGRVRGLAAATIERHAKLAGDFLHFLLEAFVVEASVRVGRITMQKVIAVMRSFLRFLALRRSTGWA